MYQAIPSLLKDANEIYGPSTSQMKNYPKLRQLTRPNGEKSTPYIQRKPGYLEEVMTTHWISRMSKSTK
jgi:hypothetical protein